LRSRRKQAHSLGRKPSASIRPGIWSRDAAKYGPPYGELLGGHIVGTCATELIQELVNVKLVEGSYPEVARIIHGHPTLSEGVMEAARGADG
jgi:pyridine nucleotide-disulfide oxidoreductase